MAKLILITNEENWEIITRENIMGLGGRWGKIYYRKIKENDECIFYINRLSVFSGIFKIISKKPNKKIKWKTGNYEYLLSLKPILIPSIPIPVKKHITKLAFIKNINNWGSYLRFPRFISDDDYNEILKIIKK